MDSKQAREIMREHQRGFVKLNPRWCAIEELISDSEKLERIEQIIERTEGTLGLDNYTVQQIKEVLENE